MLNPVPNLVMVSLTPFISKVHALMLDVASIAVTLKKTELLDWLVPSAGVGSKYATEGARVSMVIERVPLNPIKFVVSLAVIL